MALDSWLQQIPSVEIVILLDFNAQHADWLGSRTDDQAGRSVYDFALAYCLTQLLASFVYAMTDADQHIPSPILDYWVFVQDSFGSSEHGLVRAKCASQDFLE